MKAHVPVKNAVFPSSKSRPWYGLPRKMVSRMSNVKSTENLRCDMSSCAVCTKPSSNNIVQKYRQVV